MVLERTCQRICARYSAELIVPIDHPLYGAVLKTAMRRGQSVNGRILAWERVGAQRAAAECQVQAEEKEGTVGEFEGDTNRDRGDEDRTLRTNGHEPWQWYSKARSDDEAVAHREGDETDNEEAKPDEGQGNANSGKAKKNGGGAKTENEATAGASIDVAQVDKKDKPIDDHQRADRASRKKEQLSKESDSHYFVPGNDEYLIRSTWNPFVGRIFIQRPAGSGSELFAYHAAKPVVIRAWCCWSAEKAIDDLLAEVEMEVAKDAAQSVSIFLPRMSGMPGWQAPYSVPGRSMESVTMAGIQRSTLEREVSRFLKRERANRHGRPWRIGFLLHGPPGTGKTSVAIAIASQFNLPIYMFSLSDTALDDRGLAHMFGAIPKRSILLLEDFDKAGLTRQDYAADAGEKADGGAGQKAKGTSTKTNVTFSGVLNAIDGVIATQGRILIMTTNHVERLDPLLLRPGRIDHNIEMGFATPEMAANMFKLTFRTDKSVKHTALIDLANQFGKQIQQDQCSPASLQGYLQAHETASDAADPRNVTEFLENKPDETKY